MAFPIPDRPSPGEATSFPNPAVSAGDTEKISVFALLQ
jgi:hypothetical protein